MRVIRGYLKGKKLIGYNIETTRPTMDRVKESMFAMIQDYVEGSKVLDLFCGSGSLGIEAISMGALNSTFIDNNKEILSCLNKNITNLGIKDKCKVINNDYKKSLNNFKNNNTKFNIILIDAPYKMKIVEDIINIIIEYDLLYDNGLVVTEYSFDKLDNKYGNLVCIKNKKYGDKYINIYNKQLTK